MPAPDRQFLTLQSMPWLNEALGGGLACGGVYLASGGPGVGKSTLAIQALGDLARQDVGCLYLTNEQGVGEVEAALRRVGPKQGGHLPAGVRRNFFMDDRVDDLSDLPEFLEREVLTPEAEYHGCRAIVLDSIQGRGLSPSSNAPYRGLYRFAQIAKAHKLVTILIGHVTKAGTVAGPRTLQHNVDCILHMHRAFRLRPLFVPKNRFGRELLEPMILEMDRLGRVIRSPQARARSVTAYGYVGLGPHFAEAQALVCIPKYGSNPMLNAPDLPRQKMRQLIRVVGGLEDIGLAELSHEVNAYLPGRKKYRNVLDLALAVALLASYLQQPVPERTLFVGELDLQRKVRPLEANDIMGLTGTISRQPVAPRRVYVSDESVAAVAERITRDGDQRVGPVVDVRGVGDLETLVRELWPRLFKE